MTAADDREDVDRVLAGDVSAFTGIVTRWQRPLVNLAYRFCRDRGRAEDLAQEAFLRAYRRLGQWRREAAFSTWLFALSTPQAIWMMVGLLVSAASIAVASMRLER
jgi:RNA polymerase sigma-70 factor, ECF subfamily